MNYSDGLVLYKWNGVHLIQHSFLSHACNPGGALHFIPQQACSILSLLNSLASFQLSGTELPAGTEHCTIAISVYCWVPIHTWVASNWLPYTYSLIRAGSATCLVADNSDINQIIHLYCVEILIELNQIISHHLHRAAQNGSISQENADEQINVAKNMFLCNSMPLSISCQCANSDVECRWMSYKDE